MKAMGLDEIRQATGGRWLVRGQEITARGVTTDTRHIADGDVFLALRGTQFDGHNFLSQASAGGCCAAIVASDANLANGSPHGAAPIFPGGIIGVADTTAALGALAAHHRKNSSARVIAVTGSNGKTTVKRMIDHILGRRLAGTCSPKSFNNNIGVPLTLLGSRSGDDYVICEVGSNAPGEIAALASIAKPDVAVMTSIGKTHLEKLISVQGVAAEKAALLGGLSAGGIAIVWGDSEELDRALKAYDARVIRFGQGPRCDLRLTGYEPHGLRQRFEVNNHLWVELPMAGQHMATNAMAAIAVAQRFGFSQEDAAAAMTDFQAVEGRLQTIACGDVTVINDAYNANPSSVMAAADVLAGCPGLRRVIVLGDMRELGPSTAAIHEQTGREIAFRSIDVVVGVGELGSMLAGAAGDAGAQAHAMADVPAAIAQLPPLLRGGDVVLIKGSRAMAMERLIDAICSTFSPAGGVKGKAQV